MISSAVHSRNFIQGHPLLDRSQVMFRNLYGDEGADLKSAMAREDWKGTDAFIKNGRDWILDQVKKSEIRGRGGAGFSTATKWSFVPKDEEKPHYLIVNADEGEPGTCKDRQILTNEPHKVVEGALLAAYTVRAHSCYVYCRGEFSYEGQRLQKAIDEAYAAGLIGKNNKFGWDFDMYIHFGAGSYICGEETALMNSLMGNPGRPRTKPPFPAAKGLFFCPTIINNVETISSISTICRRGGDWFSSIGVKNAKGTKLFAISGCVNHPCVVEDAMGVSLRELIEKHAGGVKGGWSNLKAIIPGGLSCQMLNPKEANEAIMSYDCLEKYGSSLGTGAIIVIDKDQDIVKTYQRVLEFYRLESCHQCKVCKDGTTKLTELLEKIGNGEGTQSDLKLLEETADKTKNGICWLAQSAGDPVKGLLRNYKQDLVDRLKK